MKKRVNIDAEVLREAREILGTRSDAQTVELAITIALAIQGPKNRIGLKYLRRLGAGLFKP